MQSKSEGTELEQNSTVDVSVSLGTAPTYSYEGSVTFDNPFDYETDPAATFKFVLSQDGKNTTIKEVELSYSDFPYTLSNVKGSSDNQGDVIVYMDVKNVGSYNITFKRVAD